MKRRLKNAWFRTKQVMPSWVWTVVCVVAFLVVCRNPAQTETTRLMLSRAIILFYILTCAMWRSTAFFPRALYRLWLIRTPWTWQKPLPFGPLMPVWQDVVFIIILIFIYKWACPVGPPTIIFYPLLSYLIGLSIGQLSFVLERGQNGIAVAGILGFAAVAYFWPYKYLALALTLIINMLTSFGMFRCLRGLEAWNPYTKYEKFTDGHYPLLLGRNLENRKFAEGAFAFAIAVSVWVAVIIHLCGRLPEQIRLEFRDGVSVLALTAFIGVYSMSLLITMVVYFAAYMQGKKPPINLITRFYTRQWIIPAYDRIRLPAIGALIVGALLPLILIRNGFGLSLTYAICFPASTLCYFMAPTKRNWELTGHYRMVVPKPEAKIEEATGRTRLRQGTDFIRPTWMRVFPKQQTCIVMSILTFFYIAGFASREFGLTAGLLSLFFIALGYGYYRIENFHPAFHPDYAKWLMRTPWHHGKKLPFGPVEPVWQDLVFFACLGVVFVINIISFTNPKHDLILITVLAMCGLVMVAAIFYSIIAMMFFYGVGMKKTGLIMLALFGCLLRLVGTPFRPVWVNIPVAAAIVLLLLLIASLGVRYSMRFSLWAGVVLGRSVQAIGVLSFLRDVAAAINNTQSDDFSFIQLGAGPMNLYLSPKMKSVRRADTTTHLLISLVLGWFACLFAIWSNRFGHGRDVCMFFYPCFVGILTLVRTIQYWIGTKRPVTILGRLMNGIWFDWRRDKPLLISLALFGFALMLPLGLEELGVPLALNMGVSVFISRTLMAFVGPDVRNWRLTGAHRAPAS